MRRLIPAVVAHRLLGWMVSVGIVLVVFCTLSALVTP